MDQGSSADKQAGSLAATGLKKRSNTNGFTVEVLPDDPEDAADIQAKRDDDEDDKEMLLDDDQLRCVHLRQVGLIHWFDGTSRLWPLQIPTCT